MNWVVLVVFSAVAPAQESPPEAVAQNIEAVRLAHEGRYAEAERLLRAALGAKYIDDLTRAKIAHNLGSIYSREDRYPDAEQMFRCALQWRQENLPAASIEIAYSLSDLADIYRIEGRNREALNLLETAVNGLRQFHPDDPGLPRVLSNLAVVRYGFRKFDEAEELLRAAMNLIEKRLGPAGQDYGVALMNLGQVLQSKDDLEAAAPLYAQAIRIFENLGTSARTYLATALANSGTLYQRMNRLEEGRQAEQRALGLLRAMGDEVLRATILRNLGIIASGTANPANALPYFAESLMIQEKILGAEHPATADLLLEYASAAVRAGNKPLSRKLNKRAKDLVARLNRESPAGLTVSVQALRAAN
jgi:tetratricopeptide (TPR) repeat protein